MGCAAVSNKMPGYHLANAWRSRSKDILQWRYHNEVSVQSTNQLLLIFLQSCHVWMISKIQVNFRFKKLTWIFGVTRTRPLSRNVRNRFLLPHRLDCLDPPPPPTLRALPTVDIYSVSYKVWRFESIGFCHIPWFHIEFVFLFSWMTWHNTSGRCSLRPSSAPTCTWSMGSRRCSTDLRK